MEAAPIVPADIAGAALADAEAPPAAGEGGRPWSPGAPAVPGAGPAPVDYLGEARDVINTLITLITPLYPSLAPIYTPEVCERIARAGAPLMQKYNLTLGALGPEIAFALTVTPLIVPTVQAIRHDRETKKQTPQGAQGAGAGELEVRTAPGYDTGAAGEPGFEHYRPGEAGA